MFNQDTFSIQAFIQYVMKETKLDTSEEPTKSKIEKEITQILADRILTCVLNSMSEENFLVYEKLLESNPEMTPFEVLFSMIEEIPALNEVMLKGVNDLAEELTYDVARMDQARDTALANQKNTNQK